ncbi:peptidylprolyl isomerase, partial [Salmonella enterica subsp. enterica serovar Enteritidis]|nr:peptidylprolyl isomerase [Salmonella enterica subsp. enterica serovar Enteritidis]
KIPGVSRECNGDAITVEFIQPLAGQNVNYDIEGLEIDTAMEA